jgi:hypothetical protein
VGYNVKSASKACNENLKLVMSLFSVIDVNVINEQMNNIDEILIKCSVC